MKFLILFVWIIFAHNSWAQSSGSQNSQKESERQRLEMEKAYQDFHDQVMKSLMEGSLFDQFESRMGKMIEEMEKAQRERGFGGQLDLFENFFQSDDFFRGLRAQDPFGQMNTGQFEWVETPKERLLIAKIEQNEDSPINIEIKDGQISFKGEVRIERVSEGGQGQSRSVQVQRFNKSFSIPEDCDPEKVKFENEEGKIIVRFSKREGTPQSQLNLPEKKI